nr:hypothetical protein [uncultured Draconibacterium sp.]
MKTELLFRTANKEKYLYDGDDISKAAWAMLEDAVLASPDNDYYKHLKSKLEKQNEQYEWIWKRINYHWELNPDFAKSLKPLDFVFPKSFTPKTKVGEAFIQLFEHDNSLFLLYSRERIGNDTMQLQFILCHLDKRQQLLTDFNAGEIDI